MRANSLTIRVFIDASAVNDWYFRYEKCEKYDAAGTTRGQGTHRNVTGSKREQVKDP
jgi:hypothetical protein